MNAVVVCEFSLTVGGWSLQVPCHALLVYIFAPVRTHFAHAFITDNYSHKQRVLFKSLGRVCQRSLIGVSPCLILSASGGPYAQYRNGHPWMQASMSPLDAYNGAQMKGQTAFCRQNTLR